MAVIFALDLFKQGKACFEKGNTYDVPADVIGYFKMTGWARDAQEGDPPVTATFTHDDLSPHAPNNEVTIEIQDGVLGVADPGQE